MNLNRVSYFNHRSVLFACLTSTGLLCTPYSPCCFVIVYSDVCVRVCVCVCVCVCAREHACMRAYVCIGMCVYVFACTCGPERFSSLFFLTLCVPAPSRTVPYGTVRCTPIKRAVPRRRSSYRAAVFCARQLGSH